MNYKGQNNTFCMCGYKYEQKLLLKAECCSNVIFKVKAADFDCTNHLP